ncbi:MAG: ATP-binding cassette domain-containing protein [Defluviitaleaceae bacterium]|nr:ATP-binding cassette domain-containing protein [Defluviitaleaceae bacterium]
METYQLRDVTFTYPKRNHRALSNINLTIRQGDFVVLCGASGSGKTTLLRLLKPAVAPHGTLTGNILFERAPLDDMPLRDVASKIGFVAQSPDDQIVTDKVWHELAFGLESLGVPSTDIRLRVAEMANFFGIQSLFRRDVATLSGGQKQLLALASVCVMQPSVLILDEPTAQLDPIAAGDFITALSKMNRETGMTIVLTEHRLEEVLPLAAQVLVLDAGRIIASGSPREAVMGLREVESTFFCAMPTPAHIWAAVDSCGCECPLTLREGINWLAVQRISPQQSQAINSSAQIQSSKYSFALTLKDIWFKYEKNAPDVLKGVSFTARHSEITAILGGNGAGKSTLLSVATGLIKPQRGKVSATHAVRLLTQNPQALFLRNTVADDLREITSDANELARTIGLCELEAVLESHPYDLSGGEQQRAALAKILLTQPKILLLDEPTKGVDAHYKQSFIKILRRLASEGMTIVIVSHDIEFCAECADNCALLFDGDVVAQSNTRAFFAGNRFYTTAANRMARGILPAAITADDIIEALHEV